MSVQAPRRVLAAPRRSGIGAAAAPVLAGARAHAPFLVLLVAGAVLRIVTSLAYRPALVFYDSTTYLREAADLVPGGSRPLGYPLFLRALPIEGELALVPAVQHLMGLGIAVILYVLLLRLGVGRRLAALAAVPVLLDGYQLNIEQYVLSETLYDAFVVGGIAAILWRRRPTVALGALAGLLFAGAALTRASGMALVVPAIVAIVLLARRPWPAVALVALFAAPVLAYSAWVQSVHGVFGVTTYGGRFLYARVAPFVDCRGLQVPDYQRVLCPTEPRMTIDEYMWSRARSPFWDLEPPPGTTRRQAAGQFARAAIRHQPVEYGRRVAHDFFRGFEWGKRRAANELPLERWKFQTHFPIYRRNTTAVIRAHGDIRGRADRDLAGFLRGYQGVAFTPGTLLGLGLLAGIAAALGIGRARRSGMRVAAFLFCAIAFAAYVPSVAVNQFTYRYQLPLLVLAPPAAALGIAALSRRGTAARSRRTGSRARSS
jgi:hypothetical protein